MIGKMIGALVGGKLAENTRAIGGPTGALLGAAVPVVLRRMSIPAMIALGVGGYAVKKYMDKQDEGSIRSSKSGSGKSGSGKAKSTGSTKSTNDNTKKTTNSAKNKTTKAETAAA